MALFSRSRMSAPVPRYEVRRRGWGKAPGRFAPVALISLAFWALIARIALREGRIVVVTGGEDAGHSVISALLPGRSYGPPEVADEGAVSIAEVVPRAGHFAIDGPRDLPEGQFWDLLEACADEERSFSVLARDAEWVMPIVRQYARLPGGRPIFWLSLV
ncbi:hypothetical protein [Burkholderia sp. Ac-20365]|uniref:hypothetical protein n=1 Tax=Burkholderia sp. Ac-20365 TaxID=2703897 RepID=UPI00197B2894|nr:hypothetical protein [Burkholderia sp. Ac-20365]MBN3761350.1 hypothetical protein [Burkholderia sp. Ac-20365]